MNKKIIIILLVFSNILIFKFSNCQTAIASAGGYQFNAAGSLSFTIGETNTQTISSPSNILTQGFQQPFKLILNVKAFLQGYYQNGGSMTNVLFNAGVTSSPNNQTDSITIALHNATSPYALAFESHLVIPTNGIVVCNGLGIEGQSYYIVIKHRNALQTWSNSPIALTGNTIYDFTDDESKAYGNNQIELEPNIFALYSGDANQDGFIDIFDFLDWDAENQAFASGYFASDLNGDGNVDIFDFLIWDPNNQNFIGVITP